MNLLHRSDFEELTAKALFRRVVEWKSENIAIKGNRRVDLIDVDVDMLNQELLRHDYTSLRV
jgi:hypothetical protein